MMNGKVHDYGAVHTVYGLKYCVLRPFFRENQSVPFDGQQAVTDCAVKVGLHIEKDCQMQCYCAVATEGVDQVLRVGSGGVISHLVEHVGQVVLQNGIRNGAA